MAKVRVWRLIDGKWATSLVDPHGVSIDDEWFVVSIRKSAKAQYRCMIVLYDQPHIADFGTLDDALGWLADEQGVGA